MTYFSIIKDKDIFKNPLSEPCEYKMRPTAKGIVFDHEGKIVLLSVRGHSLFPGGGIEKGETGEIAFIRECKEEIGCDVVIDTCIGEALQFRAGNKTIYDVVFYTAHVIGKKGNPTTTNKRELACTILWKTKDETKTILTEQVRDENRNDYPSEFNCQTHLSVFQEYLKKVEKQRDN